MGGALHKKEFNFWFDPEAAQIVLRSAIAKKIMFGLDICDHAPIDKAHADQITARTPIGDLYREDRSEESGSHTFGTRCPRRIWSIRSSSRRRETDYLDVDTTFGKDYGAVIPLDRSLAPDATPVEVMMDLDFERFFALLQIVDTLKV